MKEILYSNNWIYNTVFQPRLNATRNILERLLNRCNNVVEVSFEVSLLNFTLLLYVLLFITRQFLKYEAQTALFKDPFRTAQ